MKNYKLFDYLQTHTQQQQKLFFFLVSALLLFDRKFIYENTVPFARKAQQSKKKVLALYGAASALTIATPVQNVWRERVPHSIVRHY